MSELKLCILVDFDHKTAVMTIFVLKMLLISSEAK